MTSEQILKELEELADRSGITIRFEKGDFDGGYCVLKAERLIVVNRKLATGRKASVVAQAIAEVGVEEMYLKPAVREFIEEELSKAAAEALRASGGSPAEPEGSSENEVVAESPALGPESGAHGRAAEGTPAVTPAPDSSEPASNDRS